MAFWGKGEKGMDTAVNKKEKKKVISKSDKMHRTKSPTTKWVSFLLPILKHTKKGIRGHDNT